MYWYLSLSYRRIKTWLSQFKPKSFKKFLNIKRNLQSEIKNIKLNLSQLGYKQIKIYQHCTWKYYSDGGYRISFKAHYEGKKVFIKIGTHSKKIENSIKALELFGNDVDFSPYGEKIEYHERSCYKTEFVKSYSFYELSSYIKNHIDDYISQAVEILNKLNETKTVHCDVETYNLLFRKKDKKMLLIDYDTANSKLLNLCCDNPPRMLVQYSNDGKVIFDDAYSFFVIFNKLLSSKENNSLLKLKELIGRNTFID